MEDEGDGLFGGERAESETLRKVGRPALGHCWGRNPGDLGGDGPQGGGGSQGGGGAGGAWAGAGGGSTAHAHRRRPRTVRSGTF